MSTIAVLCIAALVAVVLVGVVGAAGSRTASLDDVYARRDAPAGDVVPTDPWVTDARADPDLVPRRRTGTELTAEQVAGPTDAQRQTV